jgi:diguanylate cyclase (GGDEF)-like protein/PAS domain S-box-containing protein
MNPARRERRFLGLRWQGFASISLVLIVLSAAFNLIDHEHLVAQFKRYRAAETLSLRRQIEGLLNRSSDRLVRLSGALAAMGDLGETLRNRDDRRISGKALLAGYSGLGYELDVQRIELYAADADPIWRWTQTETPDSAADAWARAAVERARREERPVTLLSCQPECLLHAFVPILDQGRNVGVIAVGQSIADFVVEFRIIANTDIALVMPAPAAGTELPAWDARVSALTRAERLTPLLPRLAERYARPEDLRQGRLVEWNEESYDMRAISLSEMMPSQPGFILLISDVTEQLARIRAAARKNLYLSLAALAVAEFLLLYLSGIHLRRLERFARTLPLLAEGAYDQARERFSGNGETFLPRDEIDILCESAIALSDRLERNAREIDEKTRELALERDFVRDLLASAQVLVLTQTRDGRIRSANPFAASLTGCSEAQLRGRRFAELIGESDARDEVAAWIEALYEGRRDRVEHEHALSNGESESRRIVWVHTLLSETHEDGAAILSVGVDVTQRAKAESRIRWLAQHDPLTGLANRDRFQEALDEALDIALRQQTPAALLMFDVDRFKEVNDSGGHAAGDELLRLIADEVRMRARKSDIVARLGGDEFAVFMPQADRSGAELFARELNERIANRPFVHGDRHYRLGVSIGIALAPQHGASVQELMANADAAMYEAKRQGRSRARIFAGDRGQARDSTQGIFWKGALLGALQEDRLFFHFQPVIDAKMRAVVYREALLRLAMPDGRIAAPAEFLGQALRAGLSREIDVYVARLALSVIESGAFGGGVSINLSNAALRNADWTTPLIEAARARRFEPERLIFEFDETAAIEDMQKAKSIAETLTREGFRFAIDHFGTGFGGLYYFKHLPISFVKVDVTLVQKMAEDASERDFIKAVVAMAHAGGKIVVAGGVEDAATLRLLEEMGVDLVQGYFFGDPAACS